MPNAVEKAGQIGVLVRVSTPFLGIATTNLSHNLTLLCTAYTASGKMSESDSGSETGKS